MTLSVRTRANAPFKYGEYRTRVFSHRIARTGRVGDASEDVRGITVRGVRRAGDGERGASLWEKRKGGSESQSFVRSRASNRGVVSSRRSLFSSLRVGFFDGSIDRRSRREENPI